MSRCRFIAGSAGLLLAGFLAAAFPVLAVSELSADGENGWYELLPLSRVQRSRGELLQSPVARAPLACPAGRLGERPGAAPAPASEIRLLIHRFNE